MAQWSAGRLGRGLFRPGGRTTTKFTLVPNWRQVTFKAVEPSGNEFADKVHDAMGRGMSTASRIPPGGGVEKDGEEWLVGIGSDRRASTHWHLIEFGGGHHYAKAPVRRALRRFGKFKESGRPT